jgi:hypothetical protein
MRRRTRWLSVVIAVTLVTLGVPAADQAKQSLHDDLVASSSLPPPDDPCDTDAALRLVSGGDAVTKGVDADSEDDRYSDQLLKDHLQASDHHGPWCLFNTALDDKVTTDDYRDTGTPTQQSKAHDLRPRLITLTLGRQNNVINEHITTCLQKIKDHDFLEANVCALAVLAAEPSWNKLRDDLSDILNKYKVQMAGNPNLVVATTGYFNPYPRATSVATKIPEFCMKLQDTIPTCTIRWILLPPALVTLDQVVKKLNKVIAAVVAEFTQSSQGRFVFVNPYEEFEDHCTKMEVEIKTKVYHPTNTVHDHDSKKDFGCDEPWIASDKKDGTKTPFLYLTPAVTGVLILATQTTKGMGVNPNKDGHTCISDLIWESVKNKLGVPEAPVTDPCDD